MKKVFDVLKLSALLLACTFTSNISMADDLAKASQNPVGDIISVPFENTTYFGIGPADSNANVMNLKPVYPIKIGSYNLINRLIVPLIYQEGQNLGVDGGEGIDVGEGGTIYPFTGSEFGLGDINYQAFFSPADSGDIIWGVGPALVIPTHTSERLGTDKWSAGINAVVLTMPGNWVVGALAQNVWSFAGDDDASDVNKFLFQYFLNYNMDGGWYLTSTPIMTANWEADSNDRWTIPVGGGFGRLVKFGKQPVDFKVQGFWNVEKPEHAPDWSFQLAVKFLFPK
jgi:hypothetical protein